MSTLLCVWINGKPESLPSATTLSDLIERLALTGKRIAIERNGEIVPRSQHATCILADNDRLEIVHAIGGG